VTTPAPQSPGDRREDHAQAAADAVAAVYAQAEAVLIAFAAALARKVAHGTTPQAIAARRLRQTATAVFTAAASKVRAVIGAAMTGAGHAARDSLGASVPHGTHPPGDLGQYTAPLADSLDRAERRAAASLQDALSAAAKASRDAGPETSPAPSVFRLAVASAIRDTRGGMPQTSLSLSRIQAAQKALDDLAAHGITGFTDRAGRNWDLASYAEMATRTAVSSAWDDMQARMMARSGLDLIETYTHSTEGSCALCRPWLNRILSLTGATPGYATLAEAKASGFRHIQCRCSWTAKGQVIDVTNPVPAAESAAAYEASQRQRALERVVRAAGRQAAAAITPAARRKARTQLTAARKASAEHRQRHGVVMTKVGVQRRERPHGPR
jgi:hypothetical protein